MEVLRIKVKCKTDTFLYKYLSIYRWKNIKEGLTLSKKNILKVQVSLCSRNYMSNTTWTMSLSASFPLEDILISSPSNSTMAEKISLWVIILSCQHYPKLKKKKIILNVMKMCSEGRWCSMLITFDSCELSANPAGWHLLISQNLQTSTISGCLIPKLPYYLAPIIGAWLQNSSFSLEH